MIDFLKEIIRKEKKKINSLSPLTNAGHLATLMKHMDTKHQLSVPSVVLNRNSKLRRLQFLISKQTGKKGSICTINTIVQILLLGQILQYKSYFQGESTIFICLEFLFHNKFVSQVIRAWIPTGINTGASEDKGNKCIFFKGNKYLMG